jgi:hypothetical protein
MVEGKEGLAPLPRILGLKLELQGLFLEKDAQLAGGGLEAEMVESTHGPAV